MINKKLARTGKLTIWLLIAVLLASSAFGLGIAPSRLVINHEPGEKAFTARILNEERQSLRMVVFAQGEYAELVEIDNSLLIISPEEAEKSFTYTVRLPENLRPGPNQIDIVAMQLPDDESVVVDGQLISLHEKKVGIKSAMSFVHQLIVNVPYPGVYAEGKLYVTPGGLGEQTVFSISVFNRGDEPIEASGYVVIKGPTNEELARADTNHAEVLPGGVGKLAASWTADNPGKYYAEATITYNGKSFTLEQVFEVGDLFIEIAGITVKNFRLGSIAKFDIDLISKWNQPIDDVQGSLQVMDEQGSLIDTLKTTTANIPAKGKETISGYWDTAGARIGSYDVNVMLDYSGKTTQKLFETIVSADSIQFKDTALVGRVLAAEGDGDRYSLLLILVIILIVINIVLFFYFKKRGGQTGSPESRQQQTIRSQINRPLEQAYRHEPARAPEPNQAAEYKNPGFEQ